MTIQRVQVKSTAGGTTGQVSVTITAAQAGNILIAFVWGAGSSANAFAISGWDVGTPIGINNNAAAVGVLYKVAAGGETTIVCTQTNGGTTMQMIVFEYSGLAVSSGHVVLDGTQGTSGNGTGSETSQGTGSTTPTTSSALVLMAIGTISANGGSTSWSGATTLVTPPNALNKLIVGYRLPNASGANSDTANWATSLKGSGMIIAFKKSDQNVSIAMPTVTHSVPAVTRQKNRTLGFPSTASTALALTRQKQRTLPLVEVQHTAFPVAQPAGIQIRLLTITHTPIPITRQKSRVLSMPSSSHTAIKPTPQKSWDLIPALSIHTPIHVTPQTGRALSMITQTTRPFPIAAQKTWSNEYSFSTLPAGTAPTKITLWAWRAYPLDVGEFRFSLKQSGMLLFTTDWEFLTATATLYSLPISGIVSGSGLSLYVEFRTSFELTAKIADVNMELGYALGVAVSTSTPIAPVRQKNRVINAVESRVVIPALTPQKVRVFGATPISVSSAMSLQVVKSRILNPVIVRHDAFPMYTMPGINYPTVRHTPISITPQKCRVLNPIEVLHSAVSLSGEKSLPINPPAVFHIPLNITLGVNESPWLIGAIPI